MAITRDQARAAKAVVLGQVQGIPEVVGVGITKVNDDYAVKVNLTRPCNPMLPASVDGVAIQVEVVGLITPLVEPK